MHKFIAKGFTLIELMMTIAIIGILASVAVPSYLDYVQKSHYTELINMSAPYKIAVDVCYQTTRNLNGCSGGQNGIPVNVSNSGATLAQYVFTISGSIFVFPNNRYGFTMIGDYYILQPTLVNNVLSWQFSGPGVTKGYINQ